MRQYSRHGLKLLSENYRAILRKCALINAAFFICAPLATPAAAYSLGEFITGVTADETSTPITDSEYTMSGDETLANNPLMVARADAAQRELTINMGANKITGTNINYNNPTKLIESDRVDTLSMIGESGAGIAELFDIGNRGTLNLTNVDMARVTVNNCLNVNDPASGNTGTLNLRGNNTLREVVWGNINVLDGKTTFTRLNTLSGTFDIAAGAEMMVNSNSATWFNPAAGVGSFSKITNNGTLTLNGTKTGTDATEQKLQAVISGNGTTTLNTTNANEILVIDNNGKIEQGTLHVIQGNIKNSSTINVGTLNVDGASTITNEDTLNVTTGGNMANATIVNEIGATLDMSDVTLGTLKNIGEGTNKASATLNNVNINTIKTLGFLTLKGDNTVHRIDSVGINSESGRTRTNVFVETGGKLTIDETELVTIRVANDAVLRATNAGLMENTEIKNQGELSLAAVSGGFDFMPFKVSGVGTITMDDGLKMTLGANTEIEQAAIKISSGAEITNNGTISAAVLDNTAVGTFAKIIGNGKLEIRGQDASWERLDINQSEISLTDSAKLSVARMTTVNATAGIRVDSGSELVMQGGRNSNLVSGDGKVIIDGDVVNDGELNTLVHINAANKLTTDGAKLTHSVLENDGILVLNGTEDELAPSVTGLGNIFVDGDVTVRGEIQQNKFEINNGALVRANASLLNVAAGGFVNDGTLEINGGTLALGTDITGNGATHFTDGTIALKSNVAQHTEIDDDVTVDIADREITLKSADIDGTLALTLNDITAGSDAYNGGKLIVSDDLNIDDDATLKLTINNASLARGESTGELQLISVGGTMTGDFANRLSNIRYYVVDANGDGRYTIKYMRTADEVVRTIGGRDNLARVANAWDGASGTMADALNELSQHDAAGYVNALGRVMPTDARHNTRVATTVNNMIGTAVEKRTNATTGRSAGDIVNEPSVWAQAFGNYTTMSDTDDAAGFDATTVGFALGADTRISDEITLGAGYALNITSVDTDAGDTDITGHTVFAYGKYQPSQWFARGVISYGFANYDVDSGLRDASYDVSNIGISAFGGYDFDANWTAQGGLRFAHISQSDYTDSLGQHVSTDDADILTLVAGGSYSREFAYNDMTLKPVAHLNLTYDVMTDDNATNVRLGNANYTVDGASVARFGAELGIALDANITDALTVSVGYDLGIRSDYQSHTGMIKAHYQF
ncbi:MAG: autotransporter domain-containing protein [Pseudomonadota bacterium]|nr:autotransporter domain-containing protein [Pseudomonadota bacterium]